MFQRHSKVQRMPTSAAPDALALLRCHLPGARSVVESRGDFLFLDNSLDRFPLTMKLERFCTVHLARAVGMMNEEKNGRG